MSQFLQYPNKSHRKPITIPKESEKLAELMGIIMGDGGINNPWQLVVSLNSEKDNDYAHYVKGLIYELFSIDAILRIRPRQKTMVVVATSTTLIEFLVEKGAVRGNKIQQSIDMPFWIGTNRKLKKMFVRGLVDTDGCLYIHKHLVRGKKYQNIGFCFTSFSEKLLLSVKKVLLEFDICPHITDENRRIYLYEEADVIKYLSIFGSSNPRIYLKYNQWRDVRVV